jgi:hypothetical protein
MARRINPERFGQRPRDGKYVRVAECVDLPIGHIGRDVRVAVEPRQFLTGD